MVETCNMLWIGPRLGRIERACIRSVLRQGHPLTLWCYSPPADIPEGVEVADARAILPEHSIVRHHSGSVSLFSNWFRYRLQELGKGIWLDTDIYLFKPIPYSDYLLTGFEAGRVNSAPLRIPSHSPLLPPLLALFEQQGVPPWLHWRPRIAAHWRRYRTGKSELSLMPWGVAGPLAVTALAKRYGLMGLASSAETFHPYNWTEADWIRDPRKRLEDRATDATIGVHLWNERIKAFKEKPAPPGSFLARLHEEGAV